MQITSLRELDSSYVSKFIKIKGIVVSSSSISAKPVLITAICRNCGHIKSIENDFSYLNAALPRNCESYELKITLRVLGAGTSNSKCGQDPYILIPDKCRCIDQQIVKLQESPDVVPVGELPRHIVLYLDR